MERSLEICNQPLQNMSKHDLLFCANDVFEHIFITDFLQDMLLLYSAFFVFYMQTGFAMICAGSVRIKNVKNTMLKNLLDLCGGAVAFYTLGYGFAYGGMDKTSADKYFIGTSNFFLVGVEDLSFWLFQFTVSTAATTIIAGTLAERCQMVAYLLYSFVMAAFLYPIIAHAFWNPNGYLCAYALEPLWGVGVIDFAGGGVVHLTGGLTALIATSILGPRRGRFHDLNGKPLEKPNEIPGHSVALQMLGTFTLWFGWYGFNCGSALTHYVSHIKDILALAAVNTTLASGSAAITAVFCQYIVLDRITGEPSFELKYLMNGALSGLVAITGGCGVVEAWASIIIGIGAALLYMIGTWSLVKLRIDDAVDAIPVHMLNGFWGLIAVGLFAAPDHLDHVYGRSDYPGLVYDGTFRLLQMQVIGILYIMAMVIVMMVPFFNFLEYRGWFRADALEEIVGLDTSYHGGLALAGAKSSALLAAAEMNGKQAKTLPFGMMLSAGRLETLEEGDDEDELDDEKENMHDDDEIGNTHSMDGSDDMKEEEYRNGSAKRLYLDKDDPPPIREGSFMHKKKSDSERNIFR